MVDLIKALLKIDWIFVEEQENRLKFERYNTYLFINKKTYDAMCLIDDPFEQHLEPYYIDVETMKIICKKSRKGIRK